jgi:Restriction endonuclease
MEGRKLSRQPAWHAYQDEVSTLLTQLGFATRTDERIQGARGNHAIDVTARATVAGVPQLWIIECKKWRRPVPKERVLTFIGIINDVGADRGLLFAESGFQAGAIRVAKNTNLTLTSLTDFQQNSEDELASIRIRSLEERAAALGQKFLSIWELDESDREAVLSRYVGPPDMLGRSAPITVMARLSQMREALEAARYGKWPVVYYALDDEHPMTVKHWDGLLFVIEETISTCERIFENMVNDSTAETDWKKLQSVELTELLDAIRIQAKEREDKRDFDGNRAEVRREDEGGAVEEEI